ncbi:MULTISPECIES: DUF2490 domain-containing protein [Maribacter]|uniref:DUF2490 domain-containing protein n=1 Tax=Maribacter flavus TaxID=1658664 RepID=A0ABU7IKL0_9FLAO|nr:MULTISPECIES: DUF2490 domain-containing protein [Maribacter]MDC6406104.1 DUF2490 domain-containing protein [Maribacter sp. PR66]MEE1973111.1 DUF2490 domain-containing protein [Maribacter flavus]
MRRLLVVVLGIVVTSALGQEIGEDKLGSWHMYFGTNQIAEKWSIHTEAQLRYFEQAKNFNQLLLRTGLNYHIDDNAIATVGYAYIKTDPTYFEAALIDLDEPASDNISENRIFEQFILKNKVWELLFEHRYRLEQRFITNNDLNRKSAEHRARYRLQMTVPLTDIFFFNFYDEIFINLQNEAFDQNRLYAAVGLNVTHNLSVQAGYLKNHFRTVNYDRLQVAVFYNPDLRGLFNKK